MFYAGQELKAVWVLDGGYHEGYIVKGPPKNQGERECFAKSITVIDSGSIPGIWVKVFEWDGSAVIVNLSLFHKIELMEGA